MAITRPPAPRLVSDRSAEAHNARKVDAVIGRAAHSSHGDAPRIETITVRVPSDVLERVDSNAKNRRIKIPRQAWLLEAILDKLESEEKS